MEGAPFLKSPNVHSTLWSEQFTCIGPQKAPHFDKLLTPLWSVEVQTFKVESLRLANICENPACKIATAFSIKGGIS